MKKTIKFIAALLPALVLMSCSKGDPQANFAVKDKDNGNRAATTFVYTEAKIALSEIDIDIDPEFGQDEEHEFSGDYTFDILAGKSTSGDLETEIVAGTYSELEFDMTAKLDGGNSLLVKGTAETSSGSYDFEFATAMEGEFEIESDGEEANEGDNLDVFLVLDLDAMFAGVDFASAILDTDNVIRINENSNESIRALIEANMASHMSFESE